MLGNANHRRVPDEKDPEVLPAWVAIEAPHTTDSSATSDRPEEVDGGRTETLTSGEGAAPRSPGRFRPRFESWPWYAMIAGVLLLFLWRGWSASELLLVWAVAGAAMVTSALADCVGVARRRMLLSGAVLLAVLFGAWRLDDHRNLGVLALAGNREAVVAITALAALLGALTASRRWLVMQSGTWFLALAASGWWLTRQSSSAGLLADWRSYLPDKLPMNVLGAPTPPPFDSADAILLSIMPAGLFATSAYIGLLIRNAVDEGGTPNLSQASVWGAGVWFGVLLWRVAPAGWSRVVVTLILLLMAILAGSRARSLRDLAVFPVALASAVLTLGALGVAWNGLQHWWGPLRCEDFDCTPSQQSGSEVFGYTFLVFVAVTSYGAKHWIAQRSKGRTHANSAAQ